MMKYRRLYIYMNGIKVGFLDKAERGVMTFSYENAWLNMENARPISLSIPLRSIPYTGDIIYNFFDNLLPDNDRIRQRLQTKFHTHTTHPFDLLAAIGRDCVGALQIIEDEEFIATRNILAKPLNKNNIAAILSHYQYNPLRAQDDFEEFRISIAGVQEKTAFLKYQGKWQIPLGETPTSHIFKLPIGVIPHQQIDLRDSCENEWLCSQIAKAFDFPVAESSIAQFDDVKVLVVTRFDRQFSADCNWIVRLPQEDMCQALGISSNLKYQSEGGPSIKEIMDLLLGSEDALQDRELFFRAQILFYLLCAIDGHAKNFSVFIGPEGRYRLTPLYDIISAYPLIYKKQLSAHKVKMAMAMYGKNVHYRWHEIQRRHFSETAKIIRFSEKKATHLLDDMLEHVDIVIRRVSDLLPSHFPEEIASSIFNGLLKAKNHLSK